jgi:hypothetical protein
VPGQEQLLSESRHIISRAERLAGSQRVRRILGSLGRDCVFATIAGLGPIFHGLTTRDNFSYLLFLGAML